MAESLTLQMVSDARPLAWHDLSDFERRLIEKDIDPWLRSVFEDAIKKVSPDKPFEHSRRGRVLFIDGPRGAGKTSFLLTLLRLWSGDPEDDGPTHAQAVASPPPKPIPELSVLDPVLDFDPLPEDLPIHGWLLEPWRKLLEKPFASADDQAGREDILDQLSGVFERAVIGWSKARPQGGAVQKALAYQEQASGWVDTYDKWVSFVNAVVCRSSGCYEANCRKRHRRLFVIAIDDVDLQVEQIPSLLHAIRLLRHPRVLYVLTGDYDHLTFCVKLDYMARHLRITGPGPRFDGLGIDKESFRRIDLESERLKEALLEKALPDHSRCKLQYLGLREIRLFSRNGKRVDDLLNRATWNAMWGMRAIPTPAPSKSNAAMSNTASHPNTAAEVAESLLFVTARRAQHAVDRLDTSPNDQLTHQLEFVADLCDTKIAHAADNTHQFLMAGQLTTVHGTTLHTWRGDQLRIILSRKPELLFEPERHDPGAPPRRGPEAHGPLIVQLLTEANPQLSAGSLQWNPNEGIIRTEVDWNPGSPTVYGTAVLHWPWLARIPASGLQDLSELSDSIARDAAGFGAEDLTEDMLTEWFKHNLRWYITLTDLNAVDLRKITTIGAFASTLRKLRATVRGGRAADIDDWVFDLQVMTAPYWGLPLKLADEIRAAFRNPRATFARAWTNVDRLREAQWTVISNAVFDRNRDLSPTDLERYAAKFYVDRQARIDSVGKEDGVFWIFDEKREAVRAVRELEGRRRSRSGPAGGGKTAGGAGA